MKKNLFFAACLAVMACSCSNYEEGIGGKVQTASLRITANIGAPAMPRAEKTAWADGDKLGLYVCNGALGTPYKADAVYTNAPFTYTAGGWTSAEILLDENEATVFAYYPYDAGLADPAALPVDITTQTDHLYGQGDTKATILNRNINIAMKHALSQVVFRMKKTEGYKGEGVLTGITLKNVGSATPLYTAATMDVSTGALTKTAVGSIDFSANTTLTDQAVSFSSIVIPVDATAGKDMQAVFIIDGKQLQFTFPAATKWERSYRNIYDIALGNNGLVIGGVDGTGVTIEPWTDSNNGEIQLVPVI